MTYQEAYNNIVNTMIAAHVKLSESQKMVLAGALAVVHEKIRSGERERVAKEFDSRAEIAHGSGWYEPEEPAEIIREMK
jgi:hypothetical protein